MATVNLKSNVFYDTFDEILMFYEDTKKEVWKENFTISLIDTDATVGLFDKSDIIIVYDHETLEPMIVTERVFKRNYTRREWFKLKHYLKAKISVLKQELGFNIRISFDKDFIDYIHYKEEWWTWAQRQKKSQP